jgi:hypothetical protein
VVILGKLPRLLNASFFDAIERPLLVVRLFFIDKGDIFLELHNSFMLVFFLLLFLFLVFLSLHYLRIHPKFFTAPHMGQYPVQKCLESIRNLFLNRQFSNIRLQLILRQGKQFLCRQIFLDILNKVRQEVDIEVSVGADSRAMRREQPVR